MHIEILTHGNMTEPIMLTGKIDDIIASVIETLEQLGKTAPAGEQKFCFSAIAYMLITTTTE